MGPSALLENHEHQGDMDGIVIAREYRNATCSDHCFARDAQLSNRGDVNIKKRITVNYTTVDSSSAIG